MAGAKGVRKGYVQEQLRRVAKEMLAKKTGGPAFTVVRDDANWNNVTEMMGSMQLQMQHEYQDPTSSLLSCLGGCAEKLVHGGHTPKIHITVMKVSPISTHRFLFEWVPLGRGAPVQCFSAVRELGNLENTTVRLSTYSYLIL